MLDFFRRRRHQDVTVSEDKMNKAILLTLEMLIKELRIIMAELSGLQAAVAENTQATNDAVAEIAALKAAPPATVPGPSADQADIDALTATVVANNAALAAAKA